MPYKTANLIVPGLFGAFHVSEINQLLIKVKTPGLLSKLLSRANHIKVEQANLLFDYQASLPLAYYECINDNVTLESAESVIYLEPVHLELKSDHIVARSIDGLSDKKTELAEVISVLNKHFQEDGLKFILLKSGKICCVFSGHNDVVFSVFSKITGRDIKHFLPTGNDASFWLKIFNEIQMLLHEHNFNHSIGGLNGFWLWGAVNKDTGSALDTVLMGEAGWIKGYYKKYELQLPDLMDAESSDIETLSTIDESFLYSSSIGDFDAWVKNLSDFEGNQLARIYRYLYDGHFDAVLIYDSPTTAYEIKKNQRFRFFRKNIGIQKICSNQS